MKNLFFTSLLFFTTPAFAGNALALRDAAKVAFDAKDFPKAAGLYRQSFEKDPKSWVAYNAACSYALLGDKDSAFKWLATSMDAGFSDASNVEEDRDLASLHTDSRWGPLLERIKKSFARSQRLFRAYALESPYVEKLTPEQRAAGLAMLWSEIKYNALNAEALMEVNWDRSFLEYLPKVLAAGNTSEYYGVLRELLHRLDDGYIDVVFPTELSDHLEAGPPFQTRLIEGRVFVDDVWDQALHSRGVKPGTEIVAVDGMTTAEFLSASTRWLRSGTAESQSHFAGNIAFAWGPKDKVVELAFAAEDGKRFKLSIKRIGSLERQKRTEVHSSVIEARTDGIAYIRVAAFNSDFFKEFTNSYQDWKDTKAMVLDLRNESAFRYTAYRVGGCLVGKPFETLPLVSRQNRTSTRLLAGNTENWLTEKETIEPDPQCRYDKPVYVMTGDGTGVTGNIVAQVLKRAGRATVVGEQSGPGMSVMLVQLPGGGLGFFGAQTLVGDNGTPAKFGVKPDVPVSQTILDYRKGVDTALELTIAKALRETKK